MENEATTAPAENPQTSSKRSSKESLVKENSNVSRSSVKSNKSVEKNVQQLQLVGGKAEKDASGSATAPAKGSVRIKTESKSKEKSSTDTGSDQGSLDNTAVPKVPHKIIANWKQACDRTRDRTRDLLKRWRTLPEFEGVEKNNNMSGGKPGVMEKTDSQTECSGWSVHVWTTWVDRFSVDTMDMYPDGFICELTVTQTNKFSHFFTHLLDHNRDDLINGEDIEAFIERLRHFADWSTNSPEYNILREVERGFMETFLQDVPDEEKLDSTDEVQSTFTFNPP